MTKRSGPDLFGEAAPLFQSPRETLIDASPPREQRQAVICPRAKKAQPTEKTSLGQETRKKPKKKNSLSLKT